LKLFILNICHTTDETNKSFMNGPLEQQQPCSFDIAYVEIFGLTLMLSSILGLFHLMW